MFSRISYKNASPPNFFAALQEHIKHYKKNADDIQIIAVTKNRTDVAIKALLDTGHTLFGESRIQEIESKWLELKKNYPHSMLHFIGHLQSNKVEKAVALCDVIQTLDRLSIVPLLVRQMDIQQKKLDFYVQINIGREPQKHGIFPEDADIFIEKVRKDHKISVIGVMGIAPLHKDPSLYFALLKTFSKRHGLPYTSMGMSHDYPQAIAMGATHLRIGNALFTP